MPKFTLEEVADIVEREGLGNTIQNYMSSDAIEDPEVARLWKEIEVKMEQLYSLLPDLYDYE